ncbi:SoxR reducing system RseC family protein [Thermosediminibacter oceani]|uniref:Positive regulator of sigma(E), RseC/MucC n=1 Tax=Thermosediminibacter oceani (strain ATCC BAA-1034 / DSM 16646 / JW/IW-1228P) TaxID=555079 RepID=D9RXN7_THEOJ|nr:SoxR reducing system RseC family protein [Thermosediminibacter oceani]ADL08111.1 positive regulator of sigma(E), RseC/MucC [Thermosediminibacter oceani DSM 16646]
MRERAVVISKKGDQAEVEIIRTSACSKCKGCSLSSDNRTLKVWAQNEVDAEVGQVVEIEMESKALLSATFIVYVIPLVGFLLGVALGVELADILSIGWKELFSFITGLLFTALAFTGIYVNNRFFEKNPMFTSKIVNILDEHSRKH